MRINYKKKGYFTNKNMKLRISSNQMQIKNELKNHQQTFFLKDYFKLIKY